MLAPATVLLASAAMAGEPGYYHSDFVGPHSQVFVDASAQVASNFDELQGQMAAVSPHLVELDLNAALCGKRASDDFESYAAELRVESNGQTARVQAFVDLLVDDFESTFMAAMERCLPAAIEGYDAVECKAEGIHALLGRNSCLGTELNPIIGAAMDQDAELQAAVDEILELSWPTFSVQGRAQPVVPITGIGSYIVLDELVRVLAAAPVGGIQARFQSALEEVEADLEEGETPGIRQQALVRGQALREDYEHRLATYGERLFGAVQASLLRREKRGGPTAVGICANPAGLGGCPGTDVTAIALPLLESDKKLQRALAD